MQITIRQCGGNYEERRYSPRASTVAGLTESEIIDLAVKKLYGRRAFFWRDNGLRDCGIFGQVCEPASRKWGGGNSCITGRVVIIIE